MTDLTSTILDEVLVERESHDEKGYSTQHDDEHGLAHLVTEAQYRLSNTVNATPEDVRRELIVASSLLVAAVEYLDRNTA